MPRPKDVEFAMNTMKAMFGTFSPQTYWRSVVTRPIEQYISNLEDKLDERAVQASLTLADNMEERGDINGKDNKDKAPDSSRFLDPIE